MIESDVLKVERYCYSQFRIFSYISGLSGVVSAMTPKRKKRMAFVLSIVLGVSLAVGLSLYGLNQNINLFFLANPDC